MSYYEQNILMLRENHEELYQAILDNQKNEKGIICSLTTAKNGTSIVCVNRNGKNYWMGSRYNPELEAVRFAKQYEKILNNSYMIFFGLGSGLLATTIIKEKGDKVQYLFYEPSDTIFRFVLEKFDLTEILKLSRIKIIVKGLNDSDIETKIGGNITIENYRWCIMDTLPLYKQLFEKEYEEIKKIYEFSVSIISSNIATAQYFGKKEAYNNILNMKELFHSNCEEDFENVFPTDRPIIIVAAGPSLEKNVRELMKAKGKLFIIAVDTALRYLISQGIQPDLAIVADPQKPVRLFEEDKVRKIPLALCSSANNDIIKLLDREKLVFVSADSAYYEKIYNIADKHSYLLPAGGSVATLAFALARAWGYSDIVLVGQDLALAKDKVHAGKDDVDLEKLRADKIEIEGYYGEKVYSSPDYNFYRGWYEMMISIGKETGEFKVINATEGGAKINGATQKPLKEVISTYKKVVPFDFENTIRNMPCTFNKEQQLSIIKMWKESIINLEEAKDKIYEGIRRLKEGIQMIDKRKETMQKLLSIRHKVSRIIESINEYEEIYFVDRLVAEKEGDIMSEIFEVNVEDSKGIYEFFKRLLNYLESMHMGIDEIKGLFIELVESVEKVK